MRLEEPARRERTSARVIVALPELPLAFGHASARWYYVLLRELKRRGMHVTALAAHGPGDDVAAAARAFPKEDYDLKVFAHAPRRVGLARLGSLRRPFSYTFSDEFRLALDRELGRGYDVLHLEQLTSGWLDVGDGDKTLMNVHHLYRIDLSDAVPGSCRERLFNGLARQVESRLLQRFGRFRALSPRLAAEIRRARPGATVAAVPIGIDLSLYPYTPTPLRPPTPTVCLIGNMRWRPSLSAAERLIERLWPAVKRAVPAARLRIVGWSAAAALARYGGVDGLELIGDADSVADYFASASVLCYAPTVASGMKVKIIEAMAYGVPTVTTTDGVEGLDAQDGVHAGIADDDAGLAARVVELLQDTTLQEARRQAARALIERQLAPARTVGAIVDLYGGVGYT